MFPHSGYYFTGLLFLTIIAFWQSYFSKIFNNVDFYSHFHALTMLLWLAMLISQAFLIRFRKFSLHRLSGKLSYLLVPLIIISLILLAHSQITIRYDGISSSRHYLLFLQLSLLTIFSFAYSLAILNRHTPARHARYMSCTALTIIDPVVARLPVELPTFGFSYQLATFALTDFILLALIFLERRQKVGREVFPVALTLFLFFQWLTLSWTDSNIWHAFTMWFALLPLT